MGPVGGLSIIIPCFLSSNILLVVMSSGHANSDYNLDVCLKRDSISCLQLRIFGMARNIFRRDNITLFPGGLLSRPHEVRLSKSILQDADGGSSAEKRIMEADGVEARQKVLEDYFMVQVAHLWNEGSLSWDPVQTARSLIDLGGVSPPPRSEFPIQGRAKQNKNKKELQMLLPFLIAFKVKLAAVASLFYLGIAVVAQKALLAGIVSLLVSGFIATKNLIESMHHPNIKHHHQNLWEAPASSYYEQGAGKIYEQDLQQAGEHTGRHE